MNLNDEQNAVLSDFDGPRCIIAGPGSGKTSTMVAFIRSLIDRGVPATEIRAVTFSRTMAKHLEDEIGLKGIASTFHSLGYAICSDEIRKPVEPEIQHRLMVKLIKKWNLDYQDLKRFISRMRREGRSPQEALDSEQEYGLCRAYAAYEAERAAGGWMDFDSMLRDAVDYLEAHPENRIKWQRRYLIVDEAQDTDNLQWRMMQLLTEKYGNITVVGDPNQAIYSFRGAMPENITDFQKWFPGGRVLYLGRNYRSTRRIVKFVRENVPPGCPEELRERMVAARDEEGARIGLKMYWRIEDEAEAALALAQQDPLNSIILTRTNHVIGVLERICNDAQHRLRYHLLGDTSFWKQTEIQKAIEALKPYVSSPAEMALNLALPALEAKYAVDDRTERDNDALANLQTFRKIGKDYAQTREFLIYANKMVHRRNDAKGVTISTVHQAKGGQWKNVYLIGVSPKGFPHDKGNPQEEARIFFVGVSRAIDYLRLSFSGTPSPYLRKYLTDEILDKLREAAEEVERLQTQATLFT